MVSAADLLLAKDVDKVYANRSPNFFYAQIKEKKSSNQSLLIILTPTGEDKDTMTIIILYIIGPE